MNIKYNINNQEYNINLNRGKVIINNIEISEKIFNETLAIILRAYDELSYMKAKNKIIDNIILAGNNQLSIQKKENTIICEYYEKSITYNLDEFEFLTQNIYNYFQTAYPINFNYKDIDPIYFSLFLYELLPFIDFVRIDEIELNSLQLLRKNSAPVGLEESECYKALLKNKVCKIYKLYNSNHVIDTDYDRLKNVLESVISNGYPYCRRYIILYNNEFYIRDGQHRASVLKYLYGEKIIPVMRIFFKKGASYETKYESGKKKNKIIY